MGPVACSAQAGEEPLVSEWRNSDGSAVLRPGPVMSAFTQEYQCDPVSWRPVQIEALLIVARAEVECENYDVLLPGRPSPHERGVWQPRPDMLWKSNRYAVAVRARTRAALTDLGLSRPEQTDAVRQVQAWPYLTALAFVERYDAEVLS